MLGALLWFAISDRQAAASEAGKILIQHPYNQHRSSSGCALSPLLFSPYTIDCTSKAPSQIKSNQIKSLLLSHHHSTSALVSEILTSVLQTVQKNKTTVYIWTVHIYRLYRRQCAKYTYIYSVHTMYYKDILRLPMHQYTLYTVFTRLHYVHIYA